MNALQGILVRIDDGDIRGLVEFLNDLSDPARRVVARELPARLSERLHDRFEARDLASACRVVGAAILGGAEQVAAWLNRRELRWVRAPAADTEYVMSVLRRRPQEWRRDLAVRLVRRLRPATRSPWPGVLMAADWGLAAALVIETGAEPPENDAFVAGWSAHVAERKWRSEGALVLAEDPLFDHMLPRLFQAEGVGERLAWDSSWRDGHPIIDELAALADSGRVSRQVLLDGCVGRFLVTAEAAQVGPFVVLWRRLAPEVAEIPVADLVRVLPSAPTPVVQLAVDELRRAHAAGVLDDELFAEAVRALAYRPEKKHMTAAVKWMADAPEPTGGAAVAALAPVFDVDTPALRERAVKVAVRLAPHADEPGRGAIREAATRLPADLRERVAAAFGAVEAAQAEVVSAPAVTAMPPPALAPPIVSAEELAAELGRLWGPDQPARFERILAALVELTHRDRQAVAAALRPWWLSYWRQPFDASSYRPMVSGSLENVRALLPHCALAIVSPADSRELSAVLQNRRSAWPTSDPSPERFVQRRFREVLSLFERDETIPVLLATPTSPTGHVAAEILIERMELLGDAEPLEADFVQALLRLPREIDPALVVRAEKLPSRAGRRLAAWLRDGGLPDPTVTWELDTFEQSAHARLTPPGGVNELVAELCTLDPKPFSRDMQWWPAIMPSHREVVAAHVLQCLPFFMDSSDGQVEVVASLAHGDGPVGIATASVIVIGMGHDRPTQRALAADAVITLTAHGQLPAADLGQAIGHLVRAEQVKLNRVTGILDEVMAAGAHAQVWAALAQALPMLLPGSDEKPRPGLGELLKVATEAATRTQARDDVPGLAEVAARKGQSLVVHEARRLQGVISM